jgi:hypothetical protein
VLDTLLAASAVRRLWPPTLFIVGDALEGNE